MPKLYIIPIPNLKRTNLQKLSHPLRLYFQTLHGQGFPLVLSLYLFFWISNWIIIKSGKCYSSIQVVYSRRHLGRRREKNKKILKTNLPRSYKCSCPSKKSTKRKKTQASLTISHCPQNFCHFFPSKDTTRDRKAPSSTQQHSKYSHLLLATMHDKGMLASFAKQLEKLEYDFL
jgi:hypothetical protein